MKTKPVIKQGWPEVGEGASLSEALELAGESALNAEIVATAKSYKNAERMSDTPIVAVTGELNAGKSSVIGTFLSPEGMARVPRGVPAECGTHRFVYWLPKSWSEDAFCKELLINLISEAHGNSLEFLHDDPEMAAKQYVSGRDHLEMLKVPLIAWDEELDELGIGLLDCPDIQTKDESVSDSSIDAFQNNPRLEFLADAARVCSAFLLVWSHENLRSGVVGEMVQTIRGKMAEAPLYLLINKINPKQGGSEKILAEQDVSSLMQSAGVDKEFVLGAYHFDMSGGHEKAGWEDYTPDRLLARFNGQGNELPQFYVLSEGVQSDSDLFTLTKKLNRATLQEIKIADHRRELSRALKTSVRVLREWVDVSRKNIKTVHEGLLRFCESEMKDGSGKALQAPTREFLEALNESFIRTAPWLAQKSLQMAKPFQKAVAVAVSAAKKGGQVLHILKSDPKDAVKDEIERQVDGFDLDSLVLRKNSELAKKMHAQRWCPAEVPESDLEQAWEEIFNHYAQHPITSFDADVLDQTTKSMWNGFSGWKKFWIVSKALLGTLGSLAAVVGIFTAAVDGGATLWAFTSLSAMIHGSIFAAVGAAGMAGGAAALISLQKMMTEQNTLPYLSRFFAAAADAFGLPRTINGEPLVVSFSNEDGSKAIDYTLPEPTGFPELRSERVHLVDGALWEVTDDVEEIVQIENMEHWLK